MSLIRICSVTVTSDLMAVLKAVLLSTVLVFNIQRWQVEGKKVDSKVSAHHLSHKRNDRPYYYHTDCTNFRDADTLAYSTGYLYVAQPEAKRILIVNPNRLQIVKTIDVLGSECGGNCHPFGIAIHSEYNLLAIAAQNSLSGGESKVMMFKINGDLSNPNGISIQHYYTFPQLLTPPGKNKPDVRGVVFCGKRFAYADYNGAIRNFRLPDESQNGWNDGRPVPDAHSRIDWYLKRVSNHLQGHQYYIGCVTNGSYFVIERTTDGSSDNAVGAVPSAFESGSNNILDDATIWAKPSNWSDIDWDGKSRMNRLKGIAMDHMGNLFYSSEKYWSNGVSGVYMRLHDGRRRSVREWDTDVKIFGMAVDESGFLYRVQKDPSQSKCLDKYHYISLITSS